MHITLGNDSKSSIKQVTWLGLRKGHQHFQGRKRCSGKNTCNWGLGDCHRQYFTGPCNSVPVRSNQYSLSLSWSLLLWVSTI